MKGKRDGLETYPVTSAAITHAPTNRCRRQFSQYFDSSVSVEEMHLSAPRFQPMGERHRCAILERKGFGTLPFISSRPNHEIFFLLTPLCLQIYYAMQPTMPYRIGSRRSCLPEIKTNLEANHHPEELRATYNKSGA